MTSVSKSKVNSASETQFFASSAGQIAYRVHGNPKGRKTLICVHGLPTSKELFEPLLPFLNPAWRVITFDLNDYGESEKIGRAMNHKERADVLDQLRAHLNLKKFVLVAHDLGSSVAVDYMGKYGAHVTRFVIMSPPVYPDFREPFLVRLTRLPILGPLLVLVARGALFSIGIRKGMVHKERYTRGLHRSMAGAFTGSAGRAALLRNLRWGRPASMFADYPEIIKAIKIPTLIIQGFQDPYIPHTQVFRMKDDVKKSELVMIPDGAHFIPMDVPEEVALEINGFIK